MCSVLESAKNLAASAAAETEAASRLSKLHGDSALTLIRAARTLLKGRPEISAKLQTVINEVEDAASKLKAASVAAERTSDLINSLQSELKVALILEQLESKPSEPAALDEAPEEAAQNNFVTEFKESDVGRKVRLVGKKWPKTMKNKTGTIEGFRDNLLLVSGIGKEDANPFVLSINGAWEFEYLEMEESQDKDDEEESELLDGCKNCKKDPCSHGKAVLPDDLNKSLIGSRVKYCGKTFNFGEIRKFSEGHEHVDIKVTKTKKTKSVKLIERTKKGLEFRFQYHCTNYVEQEGMEENEEVTLGLLSDPHAPILDVEKEIPTEEEIQKLMDSLQPDIAELEIRQRVLSVLTQQIQSFWPRAELTPYGSSNNGFAFKNSDLDISLTFRDSADSSELETKQLIEELGEELRRLETAEDVTVIATVRVPIVKLVIFGTAVDISLYNLLAVENTRMISLYSHLDRRARQLGYLVKHLAKTWGIADETRGSLSSYAYIIMMIFYLQNVEPPVLPVLQELYEGEEKPEKLVDGWNTWFSDLRSWPGLGKNQMSVGQLWLGFLDFFTKWNDEEMVVSIRQSRLLTRVEKEWPSPFPCIAIEDPFELSRNLGAGLSEEMYRDIKETFMKTRNQYKTPQDMNIDYLQVTDGDPTCIETGHLEAGII